MISTSRFEHPPAGPGGSEPPRDQGDPLGRVVAHIKELQAYFQHHLAARVDSVGHSLRRAAFMAGLGAIGLVVLVGLLVSCVVLVLWGIAGGLALVFGEHAWAAYVVTGTVPLVCLAAGVYLFYSKWTKASRQRTLEKYEGRQQQQRRQFGHNVADRASRTRPSP
ncbi:MAG: hypothetical protein WD278_20240 [Pirellulales bacterium]